MDCINQQFLLSEISLKQLTQVWQLTYCYTPYPLVLLGAGLKHLGQRVSRETTTAAQVQSHQLCVLTQRSAQTHETLWTHVISKTSQISICSITWAHTPKDGVRQDESLNTEVLQPSAARQDVLQHRNLHSAAGQVQMLDTQESATHSEIRVIKPQLNSPVYITHTYDSLCVLKAGVAYAGMWTSQLRHPHCEHLTQLTVQLCFSHQVSTVPQRLIKPTHTKMYCNSNCHNHWIGHI